MTNKEIEMYSKLAHQIERRKVDNPEFEKIKEQEIKQNKRKILLLSLIIIAIICIVYLLLFFNDILSIGEIHLSLIYIICFIAFLLFLKIEIIDVVVNKIRRNIISILVNEDEYYAILSPNLVEEKEVNLNHNIIIEPKIFLFNTKKSLIQTRKNGKTLLLINGENLEGELKTNCTYIQCNENKLTKIEAPNARLIFCDENVGVVCADNCQIFRNNGDENTTIEMNKFLLSFLNQLNHPKWFL